MGVPINNVTRRVVYAAGGIGPYNFTFEILAATDIAVYRDDTLLALTTDYLVTINANGTGYIYLNAVPTGATQIAIVGNRTISRTTDFVTGGDFFANTLNDELDQQTIFAQQNAEGLQRALSAPQTDPTTINMTLPRASSRAGRYLSFDSSGNPTTADDIEIIYQGGKSSDPSLRNDGTALQSGDLYFNTVDSGLRVYVLNAWVPCLFTASQLGSRNRIINGAMMIDQRNNGASGTANNFTVDRFVYYGSQALKGTWQQQQSPQPPGFSNYLGFTSSSSYTVGSSEVFGIYQNIEGNNVADLRWGSSDAATITLSFFVRSSLTGTFGGALRNNAGNRSYIFSYTINSAFTWERKTITIPGDTSGIWWNNTTTGISVFFGLGVGSTLSSSSGSWAGASLYSVTGARSVVGTSGAIFGITGVQFERGSTATPFEIRPYGTELAMCQRYYYKTVAGGASYPLSNVGGMYSTTTARTLTTFPVTMRIAPISLEQSGTAGDYAILQSTGATNCSAVPTYNSASQDSAYTDFTIASGGTAGSYAMVRGTVSTAYLAWSAEL